MRLYIRLEDGNSPLEVGDKATLAPGQATTVELDGDLTLRAGQATTAVGTIEDPRDVFSPTNRPNGPMTGKIAPKLPKSGGETMQVEIQPGVYAERAVAELGVATQGGGPDSPDTRKTPGEEEIKPDPSQGRVGLEDLAATGAPPTTGREPEKPAPRARR